jgi:Pyridoxamine 5''-phosphate oxidase.
MSDIPAALPQDQAAAVDAYFTCELATISKSGIPIAWPVVTLRREDGTFLITTSIGAPQKAFNIRREPKVGMLFSDPTGSGHTTLPEILIQGTAVCPDEIVTAVAELEPYWIKLWRRQPPLALGGRSALRGLVDFYYMRLLITVTPEQVTERPPLDTLIRPKAATTGPAPVPPSASKAFTRTNAALTAYRSAVLATVDPDGFPSLRRVRLTPDPSGEAFLIDAPATAVPHPGPASILCHRHDDTLQNQYSFVTLGRVESRSGAWAFIPTRFIQGSGGDNPLGAIRKVIAVRRATKRYLSARSLPRPRIPWEDLDALYRQVTRSTPDGSAETTRPY